MTNITASSRQKVVIITGSSSGIGRSAVEVFSAAGWLVAATMRSPEKEKTLGTLPGVELKVLDVTNTDSVKKTIKEVYGKYGRIDAIVNNAGYGLVGIFEDATEEQIRRQFDTNVFGLMSVCREVIPYFREQGFGRIINVSSVGGRITLPLYSSYHSTKWAVEGFTESLQFELAPFGIRTILIEPGAIKTDFYDRSADRTQLPGTSPYKNYADQVYKQFDAAAKSAEGPTNVAKKILHAAVVKSPKARYPVGGNAPALLALRKVLPESVFTGMVKMILKA